MLRVEKAILLAGLALVLCGAGCGRGKGAEQRGTADPPPSIPVKIEVAHLVTIYDATEYVATVKSRSSAVINPQVEGQITKIYVHSGDRVAPGAPLMEIDPVKQQAVVRSQESARAAVLANLRYAQQEYDRTKKLTDEGVASRQKLDEAQAALDATEAQLHALDAQVKEQKVQLRYYEVTAPTPGIIGDIPVHVGDRVTSSTLLTTVDQPGDLEAYIEVPIERGPALRLHKRVQILGSEGKMLGEGRIDFISPAVDDRTQTILVKSRLENQKGELRTAQFIRARIIWDVREGPVIPVLAVSRINGQPFAFVAEEMDGILVARQRRIQLGQMVGNDYAVREGIKAGDRVIVSGTQFLVDGVPVAPQK